MAWTTRLQAARHVRTARVAGSAFVVAAGAWVLPSVTPLTSARQQQPQQWVLEPAVWIRAAPSKTPRGLGATQSLGVDSVGRIWALDGASHEIWQFDPAGAPLASFAGRGAAPGQLLSAAGMAVTGDGRIWAVDPEGQRYVHWHRGVPRVFQRDAGLRRTPWWGRATETMLYDPIVLPAFRGEALLGIDSLGRVVDTFKVAEPVLRVPRRGSLELPLPYSPRLLRAFDPGGFVWLATSDAYRIVKLSRSGDTIASIVRGVRPQPLSRGQVDSIARYVRTLEDQLQVGVASADIPRVSPLLEWMVVDDRGRLWISVAGSGPGSTLDVFDSSGRYVARVGTVPKIIDAVVPVIRQDKLYALAADSEGRPAILQAHIRRSR